MNNQNLLISDPKSPVKEPEILPPINDDDFEDGQEVYDDNEDEDWDEEEDDE